jgi:ABC-type bacteriocin/lantibiotic exporter with double-glycine peptidase domain
MQNILRIALNRNNKEAIDSYRAADWLLRRFSSAMSRIPENVTYAHPSATNSIWPGLYPELVDVATNIFTCYVSITLSIPVAKLTQMVDIFQDLGQLFQFMPIATANLAVEFQTIRNYVKCTSLTKSTASPLLENIKLQNVSKGMGIEALDVSFVHATDSTKTPKVEHVSFKIKPGDCVGIIGINGYRHSLIQTIQLLKLTTRSGKSTMRKLVTGRYLATEGTILLDGEDISKYSSKALMREIVVQAQVPGKSLLTSNHVNDDSSP